MGRHEKDTELVQGSLRKLATVYPKYRKYFSTRTITFLIVVIHFIYKKIITISIKIIYIYGGSRGGIGGMVQPPKSTKRYY